MIYTYIGRVSGDSRLKLFRDLEGLHPLRAFVSLRQQRIFNTLSRQISTSRVNWATKPSIF